VELTTKSAGNLSEDRVDLSTEQCQGGNRYDRDEGDDQSILCQTLSLLISKDLCHIVTSFNNQP
jgi:hypothetical protein